MPNKAKWSLPLISALLAIIITITACSPSAPIQPTPTAPAAAAPEQNATATFPPPPTATSAPTNTEVPTATPTPLPTSTPEPTATPQLALAQDGFSGWCLPENVLVSAASDPMNPPPAAEKSKIVDNALEIRNMPFSVCIFMYKFNQTAPAGLKLEIYDLNQKIPWWKTDLNPVDGQTGTVYTRLRHTYIVNPPLWNVSYVFVVRDANGTELQRSQVNMHRWATGLCWQGTYPDPITLYCPLQQDLHPWDPGYGKKLPTVTPKPK
jgi:hypothetical protein